MAGFVNFAPDNGTLRSVSISSASAANVTVAAASAGLATKLYQLVLVAAASTTVTVKDGSTGLTGAMTMAKGVPLLLVFTGEPWFTGTANTAMVITNGAAVQISGRAYYTKQTP